MEQITIYNGMGEKTSVVEGTVSNRRPCSEGWDIATIKTAEGKLMCNQYIKSIPGEQIAAE